MTALYVFAGWCAASIILGALLCAAITRGKMDSHRRQHGAGDRDPHRFGRLSVGAEIDNTRHGEGF